jgi:hypothetical protein
MKNSKWVKAFLDIVEKYWDSNSQSFSRHYQSEYNPQQKTQIIHIAPATQEIIGGKKDGAKISAGFIFKLDSFLLDDEILSYDYQVEADKYPKLIIHGMFKKKKFVLHILLKAPKNLDSIEKISGIDGKLIGEK